MSRKHIVREIVYSLSRNEDQSKVQPEGNPSDKRAEKEGKEEYLASTFLTQTSLVD